MTIVKSMSLVGLKGVCINVEADVSNGFPGWEIVGLANTTVKESKERVKVAIKNSGVNLLSKKYVINLSPADIRKEGSLLDLPIATSILCEISKIKGANLKDILIVGELSLNGDLKAVNGILSICIEALKSGYKEIILPIQNLEEATLVKDIKIVGATDLKNVINYLNHVKNNCVVVYNKEVSFNYKKINYEFDFKNVKGQADAKRGIEIAVAGMHNCRMIGVSGVGKTLLAKCIPSILPDLNFKEALEIIQIYSVLGKLDFNNELIVKRPFRSPHHSITSASLIGGGKIPKPGEISLAHNGVLFLDELTEFKTEILELLREPIEEKKITISRNNMSLEFPCNFMLICAMNPCPCGNFGSEDKICTCNKKQIERYNSKLSGPFLDRIDINIAVSTVKYRSLEEKNNENSQSISKRINEARIMQKKRYENEGILYNSELSTIQIEKFCKLDAKSKMIMKKLVEKNSISARSYYKIIRVARTIADLDKSENIKQTHLMEAIHYKNIT